jgi:hypothetical protein
MQHIALTFPYFLYKNSIPQSTEVNNIAKICISTCLSVENFRNLYFTLNYALTDSVEPRCASQCSAVLAGYEISVRLWAPTRVYPGPFCIRGSERLARNRGMNKHFEIPRKFSNCPSKCRRNFVRQLAVLQQYCFVFGVTVVGSLGYGKLF